MEGEVKGKTFKMKGHTLPGINQRSETKNLADGRSKSSTFQRGIGDYEGEGEFSMAKQIDPMMNPAMAVQPIQQIPTSTPLTHGPKPSAAKQKEFIKYNAAGQRVNMMGVPHGTPRSKLTAIGSLKKTAKKAAKSYTNPSQGVKKVLSTNLKSAGKQTARAVKSKFGEKATSRTLGKLATGVVRKGAGRLAGGPVGALAGMAYGAYKSGKKHSGGKVGSKEGQAKWKAAKKKAGKSDVWGKNK